MQTSSLKKLFTVLIALVALPSLSHAGQPCPQAEAVSHNSWTRLKKALRVPDELLEGSYRGEGHTTRTTYQLHLVQYLNTPDAFVAVMENEEKGTASVGMLKRQLAGTYLWYGIRASLGEGSQLEPVFDGEPLFTFTVNFDKKGRTANIEAVSTQPSAGVEMVRLTHARGPLLHRLPVRGIFRAKLPNDNSVRLSIGPSSDDTQPTTPGVCAQAVGSRGRPVSAWRVQYTALHDDQGSSAQDNLGRLELPGVLALRPTKFEGYVTHPEDKVGAVIVHLTRVGAFIMPDHEQALYFAVDANGFLAATPVRATHEDSN